MYVQHALLTVSLVKALLITVYDVQVDIIMYMVEYYLIVLVVARVDIFIIMLQTQEIINV